MRAGAEVVEAAEYFKGLMSPQEVGPLTAVPVRLMNDDLAVSLAPGGRLDTLLSAVDFATSPAVDPGGETTRALCLAVDPDLLVTVNDDNTWSGEFKGFQYVNYASATDHVEAAAEG